MELIAEKEWWHKCLKALDRKSWCRLDKEWHRGITARTLSSNRKISNIENDLASTLMVRWASKIKTIWRTCSKASRCLKKGKCYKTSTKQPRITILMVSDNKRWTTCIALKTTFSINLTIHTSTAWNSNSRDDHKQLPRVRLDNRVEELTRLLICKCFLLQSFNILSYFR